LVAAVWPAARYVGQLRRTVDSVGPDVVHSNSLKMHVLSAWALRPRALPLVWHLHDYISQRALTARLLRWNKQACAIAVANSESVAADARRSLGGDVRVVSVLNAVDLGRFSPCGQRADLDRLSGLPPAAAGVVRVGLVGTFGRWKGHTIFLDALARVPPDVSVRGYVVGDALYDTEGSQCSREKLEQHAQRVGLAGKIGFTGFVAEPEEAIRALDVVVHASTEPEPFGLVIAEAMACGRAVIVSDAGGAREIFTPGVDALVHVPGSAESLAARITELARDTDARVAFGRAGRQTAERRFDRVRLGHELAPVYEKVIAAA
jgi:glycosyltransferase involved in cell wall biosynthesis